MTLPWCTKSSTEVLLSDVTQISSGYQLSCCASVCLCRLALVVHGQHTSQQCHCSGECGAQKRALCLGGVPDIASSADRNVARRRVLGHGHYEGVSIQDTHSHCWMACTGVTCSSHLEARLKTQDIRGMVAKLCAVLHFGECASAQALSHAAQCGHICMVGTSVCYTCFSIRCKARSGC